MVTEMIRMIMTCTRTFRGEGSYRFGHRCQDRTGELKGAQRGRRGGVTLPATEMALAKLLGWRGDAQRPACAPTTFLCTRTLCR